MLKQRVMPRGSRSFSFALGLVLLVVASVVLVRVAVCAQAAIPPIAAITADAETVPATHSGDAADDPAIWVHPTDPASSLLIGNDKLGGLDVYKIDGSPQQRLTTATSFWGNVDVRQRVAVGERTMDVVAAYNAGLRLYTVDLATLTLQSVTDGTGVYPTNSGEGLCMYDSRLTGDVTAFVITRPGQARQFLLTDNDADGLLEASLVREFAVGSEAEGCVADDRAGLVYVAEEGVGLWRYGAEPTAGTARVLVDSVQPGGNLAADVEGVTLVDTGGDGGYLLVSAQNTDDPTRSYFVPIRPADKCVRRCVPDRGRHGSGRVHPHRRSDRHRNQPRCRIPERCLRLPGRQQHRARWLGQPGLQADPAARRSPNSPRVRTHHP